VIKRKKGERKEKRRKENASKPAYQKVYVKHPSKIKCVLTSQ
jgi:hypothetical protein